MVITKNMAYALIVLGIVAVVLAIVIDPLRGYDIYLHWSQMVVLVVGAVAALVGAFYAFVRKPL